MDFLVTVTEGPGAVLSASNLVAFVRFALLLYFPIGLTSFSVSEDAIELVEVDVEAGERKPLESSCSLTAPVTTSMGVATISTGVSSVMTDLFAGGGLCGKFIELLVVLNFWSAPMSSTTILLISGCCWTMTLGGLKMLAFVSTTLLGMVIFCPGFKVPPLVLLAGKTITLFLAPVAPIGMSCSLCTDNLLPLLTGVNPARLGPFNVTTLLATGVTGVATGLDMGTFSAIVFVSNAGGLGVMWLIEVWDDEGMIVTPPEVDAWIIVFGGCNVI